jgi:agmatinase
MKEVADLFFPPLNFAGLSPPYNDLQTARVTILPVPYDSTTDWHSGTREGPQAIIQASQYLELYDIELGREIHEVGIHTLPSLQPSLNSPEEMVARVYRAVEALYDRGKFTVMLGGEHSVSLGAVKALNNKYDNLCVLQLDAHADLRDEYCGTKYNHACIMRRVLELCPITQVGIRSLSLQEQLFIKQNSMQPFYSATSISEMDSLQQIVDSLSSNVYISIDLDVFDPSIMSAVGTPEPGGLQWHEILNLLGFVAKNRNILGFDLMELCPAQGPDSCAFLAAKLAYKLIGYTVQ